MFKITYDNVNLLNKALNGSWKRNQAIINNIANVNTPGYKKTRVEFENILSKEINNNSLDLKVTNQNHLGFENSNNFKPLIIKDKSTSTRADGNNVNIDVENGELSKNFLYYTSVSRQIGSEFKRLKTVVNDGRK
ncbi:flagellar basal body rod protein FlgB [Abyssisolibacter fermentans]|uniref:flagellar basal body rod protein FlgB n=1 Tax=Abyssisolibacter fermentans TaxID=1766203 RepID=UPI00082C3342|nr:flagellar basal body rod protein FlgB [Abyssisolibacter fermentans]